MKKNIISFIALCIGVFVFTGCDDNEKFFSDDKEESIAPGIYSTDLIISPNEGDKAENAITRGLDTENGQFTNVYPYDYIYLHRADNLTGEDHKSIRIPLDRDVDYCDGCKAIHLEVEVLDGETGGYTVRAGGEEMTLSDEEEVYFSTIPDTYWTSDKAAETPHGYDTFFQTEGINTELLRSTTDNSSSSDDTNYVPTNYNKQQLIELISKGVPQIEMTRHCTAFRVALIFTTINEDGDYNIGENSWIRIMGEDYARTNFYIKLYLGPNFCHRYNVEKNSVPSDDYGGFYVTNKGNYQQFDRSDYAFESGSGSSLWQGFGYETAQNNFLIAPLNTNSNLGAFSVYAYIKYCPPGEAPDLTSNEGAKWVEIPINNFDVVPNLVHYITIVLNVDQLNVFKNNSATQSMTRTLGGPEKMEVKPLKIIHEEKPF